MAKVAGSLSKSTEVMKIVNSLMKVPELARVMQDMSKGQPRAITKHSATQQGSATGPRPSTRDGIFS